jgi:hypothetical protein
MGFEVTTHGSFGDEKQAYTTQVTGLGYSMELPDGRRFRFARLGAAAAVAGFLYQGLATANANTIIAGGAIAMAPSAAAAGATTLTVTATGTAFPASSCAQFVNGWLKIASSIGTGIGYNYKIKEVKVATAGSVLTINLWETDPLKVALQSGTTKVVMIPNPYYGVLLTTADTVAVAPILGVACCTAAASTYIWLQHRGEATVYTDAVNTIIGCPVVASTTVAGAICAITVTGTAVNAITNQKQAILGYCTNASGTTTQFSGVDLRIE